MSVAFYRDFYHLLKKSLEQHTVSVVLGPYQCGKTVCLKQLHAEWEYSDYFDFKTLDADATIGVLDEILNAIQNNESKLYLLDGLTYVRNIEIELCKMAHAFEEKEHAKTRVVLTGSHSFALETWVNRAFGEEIGKVRAGFISYPEFLRYKSIRESSAETYTQFLRESSAFHQITSLEGYLKTCLQETSVSNFHTSDDIYENDCYLLEKNWDVFINICRQIFGNAEPIADVDVIKHTDAAMVKQALQFLKNCELITKTSADSFNIHPLFSQHEIIANNQRFVKEHPLSWRDLPPTP